MILRTDYSRTWTAQELATSTVYTWLAGIELMLQGRRDGRHESESTGISKRSLRRKGRLMKEFQVFLYKRRLQAELRIILLTPLLISQIWGFDNSLFWKCNTFQSWCDAHACAVWCSWCTLEWLGYPYDELVIPKTIKSRERICVTSCYLATKIPSALLVAVGWLQHTRYPRFRRGTLGYGITLSPIKRGKVGVRSFMRMHVSILMLPKCICYAAHAQKQHFNLNHNVRASPKRTSSGFRNRLDLWLAQNSRGYGSWLITTSINNALRRSVLEKTFHQGITSLRGLQNYQSTIGITMQTSCNDKVPSSTNRNS
jgi:hypothetical protein